MKAQEPSAKAISGRSATALVVANMIGAGVFTVSGAALATCGSRGLVLAAWMIGGLLALAGASLYGALARAMPGSGGEYYFLSRGWHPLAGFLAGWTSLFAGFTAPLAASALALAAYLGADDGVRCDATATAVIVVGTYIHWRRRRTGILVQDLSVLAKIILILVLIALACSRIGAEAWPAAATSRSFGLGDFAAILIRIFFAYSGWNAAIYVGDEVRGEGRAVARACIRGALIVTILYLAMNAIFLFSAPGDRLAGETTIAHVAAISLGGRAAGLVVDGLVMLALFTSVSSLLMAGPRVHAQMAADGNFPRLFRRGEDSPRAALILQAGLAIAAVWIASLREILFWIGFLLGISTIATIAVLVRRRLESKEPFAVPGWPWLPLLFILVESAITILGVVGEPRVAIAAALFLATGVVAHLFLRAPRRNGA